MSFNFEDVGIGGGSIGVSSRRGRPPTRHGNARTSRDDNDDDGDDYLNGAAAAAGTSEDSNFSGAAAAAAANGASRGGGGGDSDGSADFGVREVVVEPTTEEDYDDKLRRRQERDQRQHREGARRHKGQQQRHDDGMDMDDDFAFMGAPPVGRAARGGDDTGGILGKIDDELTGQLNGVSTPKSKSKGSKTKNKRVQNKKRQRPAASAQQQKGGGGGDAPFLEQAMAEQGGNGSCGFASSRYGGYGEEPRGAGMSSMAQPIPKKKKKQQGGQGQGQGRGQAQGGDGGGSQTQSRFFRAGNENGGQRQQQQRRQHKENGNNQRGSAAAAHLSGPAWTNTRGIEVGSLGKIKTKVPRLTLPTENRASMASGRLRKRMEDDERRRRVQAEAAEARARKGAPPEEICIDDEGGEEKVPQENDHEEMERRQQQQLEEEEEEKVEDSFMVDQGRKTKRKSRPPPTLRGKKAPSRSSSGSTRSTTRPTTSTKAARSKTNKSARLAGRASSAAASASSSSSSLEVVDIVSSEDENNGATAPSLKREQRDDKPKPPQASLGDDDLVKDNGDNDDDDGALVQDDDRDNDDDDGSPSSVVVAVSSPSLPSERDGRKRKSPSQPQQGCAEEVEKEEYQQNQSSPRLGTGSPSREWNRSPCQFGKDDDSSSSSDSEDDACKPRSYQKGSKQVTAATSTTARSTTALPKGGKKKASQTSSKKSSKGSGSINRQMEAAASSSSSSDYENDIMDHDNNDVPPPPPPFRSPSAASMVTKKKRKKNETTPTTPRSPGIMEAAKRIKDGISAGVSAATSNLFGSLSRSGSSSKATAIRPGCTRSRNGDDDDSIHSSWSEDTDGKKTAQAYRLSRDDAKSGRNVKRQQHEPAAKRKSYGSLVGWKAEGGRTESLRNRSRGISPKAFHGKKGSANRGKSEVTRKSSPWTHSQQRGRRQSSRLRQHPSQKSNEIICVDDSSESEAEAEFSMTEDEQVELAKINSLEDQGSPTPRVRQFGERKKISAVRIAIGKKVYSHGCELSFQPGSANQFLRIAYKAQPSSGAGSSSGEKQEVHTIMLDTITEMKYFVADDDDSDEGEEQGGAKSAVASDESDSEPMSFLAMRVVPNEKNRLNTLSNSYLQDEFKATPKDIAQRKYVVVELRSNERFKEILGHMRNNEELAIFLGEASQLQSSEVPTFNAALVEDDKKDKQNRLSSIASSKKRTTRSSSRSKEASSSENQTLLVYPFEAEESALDDAGKGLRELGGQVIRGTDDERIPIWGHPEVEQSSQASTDEATESKGGRTHYLTIRSEDTDRLEPGEFLNDTLIDFFMRWIWRKEDPKESKVHFFTSHFFTTLQEEGVDAVMSWTAKKGINVFEKTFIFLPINESLHWSLCVVVNPGHIMNEIKEEEEQSDDDDCPCILFLDSLKAHRKARVANKVRQWLNAEAKRLKKFESMFEGKKGAFCKNSMPVFDPKVPYQDNSWDCGVFVCRYAYSLYLLRNRRFTYKDFDEKFHHSITRSPQFDFSMNDIGRVRRELKDLVGKLSVAYLEMKAKEARAKRARKEEKARKAAEEKKAAAAVAAVTEESGDGSSGGGEERAEAEKAEGEPAQGMGAVYV